MDLVGCLKIVAPFAKGRYYFATACAFFVAVFGILVFSDLSGTVKAFGVALMLSCIPAGFFNRSIDADSARDAAEAKARAEKGDGDSAS